VPFVDGDDLHSEANTRKLSARQPLTDDDRWPWLDGVGEVLRRGGVVVACSALKRTYRDRLRSHRPDVVFVHLEGDAEVLAGRVRGRRHAFMPPELLASQIATLEALEDDEAGLVVDISLAPEQIVDRIVEWIAASRPKADG
jgi:carbohydrate kinase (thermoresistant glucokinase family)